MITLQHGEGYDDRKRISFLRSELSRIDVERVEDGKDGRGQPIPDYAITVEARIPKNRGKKLVEIVFDGFPNSAEANGLAFDIRQFVRDADAGLLNTMIIAKDGAISYRKEDAGKSDASG